MQILFGLAFSVLLNVSLSGRTTRNPFQIDTHKHLPPHKPPSHTHTHIHTHTHTHTHTHRPLITIGSSLSETVNCPDWQGGLLKWSGPHHLDKVAFNKPLRHYLSITYFFD